LKSTTSPMPPPPAVPPTPAEFSVFEAWVTAGTPMGATCTDGADAGVPPGVDAGPPTNYNTPPICTSNKTWTKGNHGSPEMQPGGACITCHTIRGGPAFAVAGTVYPTAHEPTECDGVNGGLTVIVTDKNGVVTNVPVNAAGNYFVSAAIAAPFHVKVTDGTKTRSMVGSLTAGDCNSCHTETGANGAPGRIMAP
jgi:mono/diheme cytochrome c family protein